MSIREIARELYRLQQEVDKLERALAAAGREIQGSIRQELRKATADRNRMKRMLEGQLDR